MILKGNVDASRAFRYRLTTPQPYCKGLHMDDLKEMKDNIYSQLREKYEADPESLPPEGKALLAVLATTRYLDHCDAQADMFADMDLRTLAAEKIMNDVDAGTYTLDYPYVLAVMDLVPLEMLETAERYVGLDDLCRRMELVLLRSSQKSLNEYETAKGLPLTTFDGLQYLDLNRALERPSVEDGVDPELDEAARIFEDIEDED